ncbi:ABC transporter permease [Subtercola endophyticus]|uniref:ABC transporter permease n=1 Tax=Subtercola endophyticus TaxID=2895559 RepID=UPI001E4C48B2|nr:ABC transporter permease [Subtercola endophyticus]UFS58678.1 ABC transporter permease [Subtercola endophyticus]
MSVSAAVLPEVLPRAEIEPPVAGPTRRRLARIPGSKAERRWLLWPPLIFFIVALLLPMIALVGQALNGKKGNAFAEALSMSSFTDAVVRTVLLAAIVTVITVIVGYVYAMGVATAPNWLKAVLMAGLLLSLWTSIMVRSFGWMLIELPKGAIYWFMGLFGLADKPLELYQTTLAMYPAMVAVMLPFAVLPLLSAINGLDREQLNAATVFGAGPLLTFRKVILPSVAPAAISGGVLVFVMSLGFYVTPLLLGGPKNMTVSVIINTQLNTANRPDLAAAMSILLVGGTIVIYLIADKLFNVSEKWG